jgi:hypothetical protein
MNNPVNQGNKESKSSLNLTTTMMKRQNWG